MADPDNSSVERAALVSSETPWLGLDSFSEETRAFFHGRDAEIAELGRRVQRKLLTVLFGQSGLGKTSILRAGLVPRLRGENFSPVYVRIDYSADAPPPAEQIKQAILRSRERKNWTGSGYVAPGESLWEFLHHRADHLHDPAGHGLVPLLIFDQFEEVFTLGQADDAGRRRAADFLSELADLVENRAPAALEARIERDEVSADQFDFGRADYRILISLREDYLAHLEALKDRMPSVTQNRLRLARMSGAQALEAVRRPGGALVDEDCARAIVRFVSGAEDLATAEVEPALLSLVCRELNNARLAQGRAVISTDLLAGSHATILADFYERALADQPRAVRRFIEDELLTDSGYRETIAEERVRKAFAAAGAPDDALTRLVDRRVLRVEDRLDVRRVELTHDVLCGVIAASRDGRREREAKEAVEAQLAATRAEEAETRRVLRRTRLVAVGCAALALVAIGSAVFALVSIQRARVAEAKARDAEKIALAAAQAAQAAEAHALTAAESARTAEAKAKRTRQLADTARTQAERLVSFLIDDFYEELAPTGRLETVARLAQQAIAYFDGLPATLRTPTAVRGRALALTRYGMVLRHEVSSQGGGRAQPVLDQAVQQFERLYTSGDHSEATMLGYALALRGRGESVFFSSLHNAEDNLARAEALLRPLAEAPKATRRIRFELAEILLARAVRTNAFAARAQQRKLLDECREILRELGALELTDLAAASAYANATNLAGKSGAPDNEALQNEALAIAEKVLARRPADIIAMQTRAAALSSLSGMGGARGGFSRTLALARQAEQAWQDVVRFDPMNYIAVRSSYGAQAAVANLLLLQGRINDAVAKFRQVAAAINDNRVRLSSSAETQPALVKLVAIETARGNQQAAAQAFRDRDRIRYTTRYNPGSEAHNNARTSLVAAGEARHLKLLSGDYEAVIADARAMLQRVADLERETDLTSGDQRQLSGYRELARYHAGLANLLLGRFGEAEAHLRDNRLAAVGITSVGEITYFAPEIWLAVALARQGRRAEADALLAPTLSRMPAQPPELFTTRELYARCLYAHALAQPDDASGRERRAAALARAAQLLDEISDEAKQLADVRMLMSLLAEERGKPSASAGS